MKSEKKAAPAKAESNGLSLELLIDGAQKAFDNAEALFGEAQLLAAHGSRARALCLHQISIEECSKVEYLGGWAMSQLLEKEGDREQIGKAFRSHAAKNKLNAYMLASSAEEIAARESGDWDASSAAFKKMQDGFHQRSNKNKNDALYVDWTGSAFVAPAEAVTEDIVADITRLNMKFLGHAALGIRMFARVQSSSAVLKPLLIELAQALGNLTDDKPADLKEAIDGVLGSFIRSGAEQLGKT
ncbi:AbiV family abortive infection protein [Sphingopyxis sp.]|uniref:AbiV family abortive infection protein n=1 Tax=Sphingopyxis sp. TaxID=1908224 RepID=UPI002D782851|nr:AbiV family abortive infection protein [Sphingopyxis sp.]HET6523540.1 AbiV family abortive infection protein [Sphingopyxis sp.]